MIDWTWARSQITMIAATSHEVRQITTELDRWTYELEREFGRLDAEVTSLTNIQGAMQARMDKLFAREEDMAKVEVPVAERPAAHRALDRLETDGDAPS